MLESILSQTVPSVHHSFNKLTSAAQPYHFDRWADDGQGVRCLYYWFSSRDGASRNVKRVPISEIRAALKHLEATGALDRPTFRVRCPVSESAGPCGFAVVGRLLEAMGVAKYLGHGKGFHLINAAKAHQYLGSKTMGTYRRWA